MAEPQAMIGFWSYSRADARSARGRLDVLRDQVADELRLLMGSRPGVELWHDTSDIPYGDEWERVIRAAIKRASFFIPVVTPAFLQSEWCCNEVVLFLAHQEALGRSGLIFPIFYVDVRGVDSADPDRCHDPKIFDLLLALQGAQFASLRNEDVNGRQVLLLIERFAREIVEARPPTLTGGFMPLRFDLEQRKTEDPALLAEAQRIAEEAARRAEEQRKADEAARLAEEQRKAEEAARQGERPPRVNATARAAEATRKADEEARVSVGRRRVGEIVHGDDPSRVGAGWRGGEIVDCASLKIDGLVGEVGRVRLSMGTTGPEGRGIDAATVVLAVVAALLGLIAVVGLVFRASAG